MDCCTCYSTLRDQAWFCTDCGTPVSRPCEACGAGLEPDDRFCGHCGCPTRVSRPVALPGLCRSERFLPL